MSTENNQQAPAEEHIMTEEELGEQRQIRRNKLADLRAMGRDPYVIETYDVTAHSMDIKDNYEAMEDQEVSVAGRIMSKRVMGKAAFFDILDKQGRIQCYVRRDDIGQEEYKLFKTYDIGDIVGLKGIVFKTRTGEVSIHTNELTLLCKSLQVLPDKWSGLQDVDMRYRQRYVDLIMNRDVRDTFIKRAKIISKVREVLEEDYGFLEVETPVLNTIAGGANARPFITHHNSLDIDLTLRISLELHLKRLIVGGLDRVYEIGKVFRNEGMDKNHSPEFTSMECYMAYGNLDNMMELMEQIVYKCAMEINGSPIIKYGDKEFDVTPPWNKLDMTETVSKITGIPSRFASFTIYPLNVSSSVCFRRMRKSLCSELVALSACTWRNLWITSLICSSVSATPFARPTLAASHTRVSYCCAFTGSLRSSPMVLS